ncbi:hypothetical protein GOBAR_DD27051 [Gossypium barbadense]|nr:hypothetical protein GOBAR_DD27051 [Gossypium barbadense]
MGWDINGLQTIQLRVILQVCLILELVDSDSTHNFTGVTVAKHLGLPIQAQSGLRVIVANGEKVISSRICPEVTFTIDNNPLEIEFDVVLGIKKLQTLGPVV